MGGWSCDTLKEYFDSHLDAIHKEIVVRIDELHREHDKFEETVRQGFVKQNEFRGSLEDLGRTMATRRELETLDRAVDDRVEALATQSLAERGRLEDRIGKSERWQARLGGGLLLIGLVFPAIAATLSAFLVYLLSHN